MDTIAEAAVRGILSGNARHPHTGEPLAPIGHRKDGRPIWPVIGASPDDGDGDGDGKSDDGADDSDDNDDGSDDEDGDETDWKAKFEQQQRVNRTLERRTQKTAAQLKALQGKPAPKGNDKADEGDKPDVEKIRAEAKAEAEREALNGRIEDKIEAKARAFADPEDAVSILLRSHKYDDFLDADNKVDVEAIAEALKELGEKKPHLLAQGGRFQGGADGGARKETKGRAKSLGDAISRHYEKS